ncbi:ribulose-phosphate 3-epimerase [bacterium]|jgi:ribulose-phosphate 3-epimerase|nr:ribulose-phosphate 3-epimerase [bacterium]MBT3850476.1 ribulose-phosphate 3-epimerase [bacterium]MBT4434942.1 ribulose-phosphate 3-epimerase [bacterium]
MKNFIAASIIAADFWNIEKEFKKLNKTRVKWIHYDVMDGHYVPNITIGSCELDALSQKSKIPIDIHFMVSNPDEIVPHFVKKYKNMNIVNITVHCETCKNIKKLSRLVRKANMSFGLAIHPNTSISKISRFFDYIDLALVMTVKPGFAGQKIIPSCIRKVKELSELFIKKNISLPIQVDGGIKLENISKLSDAGANIIVSGTGIFGTKDYESTVKKMVAKI